MTRNSITGQVKAMSMIVAILGLIPDRRAAAGDKSPTDPIKTDIYKSAWLREQEAKAAALQANPVPPQQEDSPAVPEPAPDSAAEASPGPDPSESNTMPPAEAEPPAPGAPIFSWVPDSRVPFSINRGPFNNRRR
jgi:hypothetical protein